jgi:TonB family protein
MRIPHQSPDRDHRDRENPHIEATFEPGRLPVTAVCRGMPLRGGRVFEALLHPAQVADRLHPDCGEAIRYQRHAAANFSLLSPPARPQVTENKRYDILEYFLLTIVCAQDYGGDGYLTPRRYQMKIAALLATLALAPALLHAQTAATAPQLEARLNGAQPVAAAPAGSTTTSFRVSTGVVPPHLIHTVDVASTQDWEWEVAGPERTAEVSMTVDATGKPTDVKIVKSAGSDLDKSVLEAVNQYRFTPATVSNQAAAMNVDLTINVLNPNN